ncbi:TetR/AcrR family transcriptional regulator [Microbacterium sp. NPDC058342]|uniref:TetR/AcrR family transcriptional regulator n=1 Tax=Microbacterium sp. NPDC058342 TaxID=3346454 RepID=UPI00364A99EA
MGRPRDPDLEQRLLDSAWKLVTTRGYAALSLSQVAADAGAHRTDVYRRWATKARLVAEAMAVHLPPITAFDTGSLRGDMRQYLEGLWQSWSSPWIDGVMGVLSDLEGDAGAEAAFASLSRRRAQPMRDAIVRAIQRGEVSDVPDLALLGDLLEGPIMHRRMIGRQVMTSADLDALAAAVHGLMIEKTVAR